MNKKDEEMFAALRDCVKDFAKYLGADQVKLGDAIKKDRVLKRITAAL